MIDIKYIEDCKLLCQKDLTEDIMPFWMKNGVDKVNGGVYTSVDKEGKLMDSTKSVWFQGRFGYVCSYYYNNIRKDEEILKASKSAIDFIEEHCIDADGHMFFAVTAEGNPVQKRRYVFSECFASIAMAEYALASGDNTYADKSLELFNRILKMISTPGFLPPKFNIEARGHSITMILINVALVIKQVSDAPVLDEYIDKAVREIRDYFMHPEFHTVAELTWNAIEPISGYEVYRDGEKIAEVMENNFTDNTIPENGTYCYTVAAKCYDNIGAASEEACAIFNVDVTEIHEANVSIYPNPTKDNFFIVCDNMTNVRIYNILGEMISEESVNDDRYEVGGLNAGTYFVQIETGEGVIVRRVVKL